MPNPPETANVGSSITSVNLFPQAGQASASPLANGYEGRTVFNDSTAVLYLKFGSTASATSFTVEVAPGGYYEFPEPVYLGPVDGIWASVSGFARLTSW